MEHFDLLSLLRRVKTKLNTAQLRNVENPMDMIPKRQHRGENRRAISWRNYKVGEDLLDALGILDGDLNIVQLSRSGRELIGIDQQEDENIAFCEIIHPRDRHQAQAALEHCLESNSTLDIEIRLNETHEQQCWAHLRAVPMSERNLIFVTIYNISSYKAEIDQLGRFFSLSPDLFCVMDFEGGFLRINSAWEQLLGWPLNTLIDNNFSSFVHPSDRERTDAQYANIIVGADTVLFENRYRTVDGTYKWIEWKSVALTEEKLIFANARDITARKEFESTLRDMEAAQISDRTKSTFLSAMSHELRTPLNGIMGIANIAYEEAEGEAQRDLLETIKTSAESLSKIVEDILDFTKIDAGQIELESHPFSIRALMTEIKRLNSIVANDKNIPLIVDVEESVPDILENDANRLSQVLRNLVDNAIRFTCEGSVKVSVNTISHREDQDDDSHCWLRFTVIDTGQGIAPSEEAKIFDAFHQAQNFMERRTGGMGIGLAVSKQLLELMGGSIMLKTQVGEGSTFTLDVPFKTSGSPNRDALPEVVEDASCRSLHILVVEDNLVNQKVAIRFLTKEGHSVIVAENGHLAIEAFEKEIFDLILMDIQMPEMDGITATECIRKIEREGRQKTPIVAMTAHASKNDENGCYAAGMDDFIVKPFKPEKLRGVLFRVAQGVGYVD